MKIIESKIAPNPKEAQYWIDLSADANRNVIKSFNGHKWVVINGGDENLSHVLIEMSYSKGDTLSDEDVEKLSKAFAENIPIIVYVSDSASLRNTMVTDNYNNVYTIIFVLSMEMDDSSHGGIIIRMCQLDVDMNTKTVSDRRTFYINDYFMTKTFEPYFYSGTINEEVFNEIKSAANYGCNIMWDYKKLNVTRVTNNAVYGFIDDGDSITKYEFTKTAVNTVETKQYAFK